MSEKPKVAFEAFIIDLESLICRYAEETELNNPELIGALELVKSKHANHCLGMHS